MDTWSSWPALVEALRVAIGPAVLRSVATTPAAVYCAIMNPLFSPGFRARNGGSPDSDGFTSCSTRRSLIDISWVADTASTSSASDTGCP